MRTLVVGDVHGRYDLALGLLRTAGVVDGLGTRVDYDVRTVQVGDLANCVARDRDQDLRVLRKARAWFNVRLVGNHEYPYLGGGGFSGFARLAEVEQAILNVPWQPAVAVGATLVTHAGVHPALVPLLLNGEDLAADEAEAVLRAAWQHNPAHPWFDQCGGARGGSAAHGGILWRDANAEPVSDRWNQVFGHTPDPDGPTRTEHPSGTWSLNIDVAGKAGHVLCGAWIDEAGELLDTIVFPESPG